MTSVVSESEEVLFEIIDQHIALLTLNRPDKRHAINASMTQRVEKIVKETEANQDIRVVVITSSGGPSFCAGADLAEVAAGRGGELVTADGGFAGFVESRRTKPWIAAVQGAALGGGLEIALACDLKVCSESTMFGLPEVKRGLIAGAGGIYRLPRQVPRTVALEMIATGDSINAEFAKKIGLVNHVVKDDEVINKALEIAKKISDNAPVSVVESLKIARASHDENEEELIRMTHKAVVKVMSTEDASEGPKAFVEKRKPVWKGQ